MIHFWKLKEGDEITDVYVGEEEDAVDVEEKIGVEENEDAEEIDFTEYIWILRDLDVDVEDKLAYIIRKYLLDEYEEDY